MADTAQPAPPDRNSVTLELGDIQASILRPRPSPYKGEYIGLKVSDAWQGCEMLQRLLPHVAPADDWWKPTLPAWLGIAFTFAGLKALGLSKVSLDSFPAEFREGMASRASILNDVGSNAPAHWEKPFGTSDLHIALAIYSKDDDSLETVLQQARVALKELPAIAVVYRLPFSELPGGRNPFGFRDGLHNPDVEGSGSRVYPGFGRPIKAGEFVLGYPDELGEVASTPEPEVLRKNGTFVAFESLQPGLRSFAAICTAKPLRPKRGSCSQQKSSGDGPVEPRWPYHRIATMPNWAKI